MERTVFGSLGEAGLVGKAQAARGLWLLLRWYRRIGDSEGADAFALGISGAAPEIAPGRGPSAHGFSALGAVGGGGVGLLFSACLEGPGVLGGSVSCPEGCDRGLGLEGFQGARNEGEHRIGNSRWVVGIEPWGEFPPLLEGVSCGGVEEILGEAWRIDGDSVDGDGFLRMDGPWNFVPVEEEQFVIAAEFTEVGAGGSGARQAGVARGFFGAFEQVVAAVSGGAEHVIVVPRKRVIPGLGPWEGSRDKPAAEPEGLHLD